MFKRFSAKIKEVFFLSLLLTSAISAQNVTLSGYVRDGNSGEELIGANVFLPNLQMGAATNAYGFYSLTLPKGKYKVKFSYIGYEPKAFVIDLSSSKSVNVELHVKSVHLNEVVVETEQDDENVTSTQMGTSEIIPKEVKAIPVFLGEQDILKTIQLMPGVSQTGDGNSGFFVRGGNTDQNLILLDEATVYNASHLLGFFSVFNSDAIKNAKLIKGSMPPEYGGRLASVLDINMKEGNMRQFHVNGGIGLISSRLTAEGPIVKDKGSFLVSGRRTYADLLLKISNDEELSSSVLYFYDLNLKVNYRFNNNDRLFLSGYFGRDNFMFKDQFGFDWGNITATLRWNHLFSDKLFMNTSLIYSDYNYVVKVEDRDELFNITSGIRDLNLKSDFEYFLNSSSALKFGGVLYYHTFIPGVVEAAESSSLNSKEIERKYALEGALYISHEYKFSPLLKLNYGFRYSNYTVIGPGTVYAFDENETPIDTTVYSSGDIIKSYGGLEPRIAATYLLDETSSVKVAYARNRQYVHLLTTSSTSSPIAIWQPSTSIVQPEIGDQISLGYFKNFNKNAFETSVEVYYKEMKNQIDYKNGADVILNEYVESQLTFGKGRSYGIEFFVKKNIGNLTGWISYTLSRTERTFAEINDGDPYPARQDRTHDVSVTLIYQFNERWTFSANWIYYTGDAATFPSGKYEVDGTTINLFTERNGYRMPDYHRLDLGATWLLKKNENSEMSLTFSLFNAYGRRNAYSISFRENEANPLYTEAVRLALFTYVPSVTFNFRF
jgi:hypothetical protein